MLRDYSAVELSAQRLKPGSDEFNPDIGLHLPLLDLELVSPYVSPLSYRANEVYFPLSNDECTNDYFKQLSVRSETPEFKNAKSRVAILVGESALAANIKYIPEETIVVLDSSPDMCIFMDEYVASLREASGPEAWFDHLKSVGPADIMDFMMIQLGEWGKAGRRTHPLIHQDAFEEAKKAAKQKTIVTWCADITDSYDVTQLGQALRERDASVTMMNLTNLLPYVETFKDPSDCAERLDVLPLTRNAPILTTSLHITPRNFFEALTDTMSSNKVTGPFFGLANLARARADMPQARHDLGAIVEHNVSHTKQGQVREEDLVLDFLSGVMNDIEPGILLSSLGPLSEPLGPRKRHRFWRRKK